MEELVEETLKLTQEHDNHLLRLSEISNPLDQHFLLHKPNLSFSSPTIFTPIFREIDTQNNIYFSNTKSKHCPPKS